MFWGAALVRTTSMVWGWHASETKNLRPSFPLTFIAMVMASAAGRALVEQGGVGDLHAGEVHHHGLEVQERLHAPLRDLRLVGGVGRVPARILQDVAEDDRGRVAVRIAHADHGAEHPVALREGAQVGQRLLLCSGRGETQLLLRGDGGGDGLLHQLVERAQADCSQHRPDIIVARGDVAADELSAILKGVKGQAGFRHEHAPSTRAIRTAFRGGSGEAAAPARPGRENPAGGAGEAAPG